MLLSGTISQFQSQSSLFEKHKAVQILKPSKGKSYELDKEAIKSILNQNSVADCAVAVYSIAGVFRTGKSLLLNFFLRFLKSGRSENWLNNKEEEIKQDFVWRGGGERCTAGIWMWNEPFQIAAANGQKVVIFLIDTQGTFDNQSDMKGNSLIFALSTLISSVQIFNVMRNIQENDLQHLHLFTDYARTAKNETQRSNNKPFQHLIFLIRDYMDPDFRRFWGGKKVLSSFLRNDNQIGELASVRNNIFQSFDSIECFCCSPPGKAVAIRNSSSPPLKLINFDKEFLDEINELVYHLFVKDIVVKQINGSVVTGSELINFIAAYCNVFESGIMPHVTTVLEASAKATMLASMDKFADVYDTQMTQICRQGYKYPQELRQIHNKVKNNVLKNFESVPKLGDRNLARQYLGQLSQLLDGKFELFEKINSAKSSDSNRHPSTFIS